MKTLYSVTRDQHFLFVTHSHFLQADRDEEQDINAELAEQDAKNLYEVSTRMEKYPTVRGHLFPWCC